MADRESRPARAGVLGVLALALALGAVACGKKPEALDAPARDEPVPYPRTYPST